MFDQLFTAPQTVKRYFCAPLFEERLRYLAHGSGQGSTRSSLRLIAQHQLLFIGYLNLLTGDPVSVRQIHSAADLWVGRQPKPHVYNVADCRYGRMRFISEAKKWLNFLGRLETMEAPRRPYTH